MGLCSSRVTTSMQVEPCCTTTGSQRRPLVLQWRELHGKDTGCCAAQSQRLRAGLGTHTSDERSSADAWRQGYTAEVQHMSCTPARGA